VGVRGLLLISVAMDWVAAIAGLVSEEGCFDICASLDKRFGLELIDEDAEGGRRRQPAP
jgi:hypothetical protein